MAIGNEEKMAARLVVCNDLLCFLLNKYGNVSNRVLRDTLVESFEAVAILLGEGEVAGRCVCTWFL